MSNVRLRIKDETTHVLCAKCSYGHRTVDQLGNECVRCYRNADKAVTIHEPIVVCNEYSYAYQDAPWAMAQVAWLLQVDKKGQMIGFRPPQKDKD